MATPAAFGSRASRAVCLRYVMRHPVAFRQVWTPKVTRRRVWMRLSFMPILLAMDRGDSAFYAGRGSGKTMIAIAPELPRKALMKPGEETLLTTFRRVHTAKMMEQVIDYFEMIPFFKLFLKRVQRSPVFIITLHTGHQVFGISIGDDAEARTAQGVHASTILIEEAHQYPMRAYLKLEGAKDPRGSIQLMMGVPDGRLDTPFRKADKDYQSFTGRRFHLSRRHDPYFDAKTKQSFIDLYNSEESDLYKQEVDALHGSPTASAWELALIYSCMDEKFRPVIVTVSGKTYRERAMTPEVVLAELSKFDVGPAGAVAPQRHPGARVRMAMDVGYSEPSEIGLWEYWHDRWELFARVRLVNRMEHDDQAAIVDALGKRYQAEQFAIDATEGEGRAIATELEKDPYWSATPHRPSRVIRVGFQETVLAAYQQTPEGEVEEIWESARELGTRTLRTLFSHRSLLLPNDENIPADFNQEMESRTVDGKRKIITPPDVHITDMFRVFAILVFLDAPPQPPDQQGGPGFALPEWGGEVPWGADAIEMAG